MPGPERRVRIRTQFRVPGAVQFVANKLQRNVQVEDEREGILAEVEELRERERNEIPVFCERDTVGEKMFTKLRKANYNYCVASLV